MSNKPARVGTWPMVALGLVIFIDQGAASSLRSKSSSGSTLSDRGPARVADTVPAHLRGAGFGAFNLFSIVLGAAAEI